jgi:ribosomal protein L40E
MQKYKICPACQTKNAPDLLECIHCEADLTRVKLTDEETEKMQAVNAAAPTHDTEKANLIRVCACGAKNPANARKCLACHEDISDLTPTPDGETDSAPPTFLWSSLDGTYVYKFCDPSATIGREHSMGTYLSAKHYVSRAHAKLSIEHGALYIENLSHTNFTYVNDQKITGKVQLNDGDEVGLGGANIHGSRQPEAAYFLVRVSPCT